MANELDEIFNTIESASYRDKVALASSYLKQILDKSPIIIDDYDAFKLVSGCLCLPEAFNNGSVDQNDFETIKEVLENCGIDMSEYDLSDLEDNFNTISSCSTENFIDHIYKHLENEEKIAVTFMIAIFASINDRELDEDERQLVSYYFVNGYWDSSCDIWASTKKKSYGDGNSYSYSPTPSFSSSNGGSSYYVDEGSYLVGVLLALFLNWIGLIIAVVMKKRKTTKGAVITFLVMIGFSILAAIVGYILVYVAKVVDPDTIQQWLHQSSTSGNA